MLFFIRQNRKIIFTLFLILFTFVSKSAWPDKRPYTILVIHSYDYGSAWAQGISSGLIEKLGTKKVKLEFEYLDSKRYSLEQISNNMAEFFKVKYSKLQPDLIISCDNNSLNFLREFRKKLFKDVPVIFCGINNYTKDALKGFGGNITGVAEKASINETASLMLSLMPELTKIYVVVGNSETSKQIKKESLKELKNIREQVEVVYLENLTKAELIDKLELVEKNNGVLLTLFNKDRNGNFYNIKESAEFILKASKAPVFSLWDFYLDTGVIGGKLLSAKSQGLAAGELALKVMDGEDASSIPIVKSIGNRYILDFKPLLKSGLHNEKFPRGTKLINKPDERLGNIVVYLYIVLVFIIGATALYHVVNLFIFKSSRKYKKDKFTLQLYKGAISIPVLSLLMATFVWLTGDYIHFNEDMKELRKMLMNERKNELSFHVKRAGEGIEFLRKNEMERVRKILKSEAELFYSIAPENIFDKKSSKGFFDKFYEVNDSIAIPFFVKKDKSTGRFTRIIEKNNVLTLDSRSREKGFSAYLKNYLTDKEKGFFNFRLINNKNQKLDALFYVEKKKDSGFVTGSYVLMDGILSDLKKLALKKISSISYSGGEGYVFGIDYKGNAIATRVQPELVGKNIINIRDSHGVKFIRDIIEKGKIDDGGFVSYSWNKPGYDSPVKKISYVSSIRDWEWIIGTGLYLDDIDMAVFEKRKKYFKEYIVKVGLMVFSMIFLGLVSIWMGRQFASVLSMEFETFKKGITNSAKRDEIIDDKNFKYHEFIELASYVNNVLASLKNAQRELKLAGNRLELAMDAGDHGFWDWDLDTNEIYFSPFFFKMLGYGQYELPMTFDTWENLIYPADKETVFIDMKESIKQGKPFEIEYRLINKNNDVIWILAQGKTFEKDVSGIPQRSVGIHVDIHMKKLTEEKLIEANERLEQILDSIQSSVLLIDADNHKIIDANPAACLLMGYEKEEIIGRVCNEIICRSQDHECSFGVNERALESVEGILINKKGEDVSILRKTTTVEIDGRPCILETFVDIGGQKKMQNELEQTLLEAEKLNQSLGEETKRANELAKKADMANEAKSEFLANMSHEIRTPMNGVIGMAGLLLDTDLNHEQYHFTEMIIKSGESLLAIINDILDFSKIEAGKLDIEILNFDLRLLMEDFGALMSIKAEEKNIEFISSMPPDVPAYVKGDPGRIRQVLNNLAGNALKFTSQGEVAVIASVVEETDDEVLIKFEVKDTGIGIPEDKISKLFNSFEQVDTSTTRKYGGTGLGLAISKQLSELMGGSIGVESKIGEGSVFFFTSRFEKQLEQPELMVPASIKGLRTLIVDDNATNRDILRKQIEVWGMDISDVSDGKAALSELNLGVDGNNPYDIAILDMQMPEMSGEELGKMIKSQDRISGTRLVMMTSMGKRGDAKKLEQIGFDAYLLKPVRQYELYTCLTTIVGREKFLMGSEKREIVTRHSIRESKKVNLRVLLADDNITNQQVAVGMLKKFGIRVDCAANGEEAVTSLSELPYDLVFMDVEMPVLNGLDATRKIRALKDGVNFNIPIIAMTARALKGDRETCFEAGMDDYITKPITPESVAEILEKWAPEKEISIDTLKESGAVSSRKKMKVFDEEDFLFRMLEDLELAKSVMKNFVSSLDGLMADMDKYYIEKKYDSLLGVAHSIRGAASNVGAGVIAEICGEIERFSMGKMKLKELENLYTELPLEIEKLKEELKIRKWL